MELYDSFRRIIDIATEKTARAIIIAGDLFDTERVTRRDAEAILDDISRASDITFLYLPGNHEREALMRSGAEIPKNLKIFGEEWTYFELDGVTFAGRSSLPPSAFDSLRLDEKRVNIAVLHGSLRDRCDGKDSIGKIEAARCPIDYLALGHYHSYSEEHISKRCLAVYSGTPEGRGFDETSQCGYVEITVKDGVACHKFVPSAKRRLHILKVDITEAMREFEIEDRVVAAIGNIPLGDLLRVVLIGERDPQLRRDCAALTERLSGGRFYFEVRDESRLRIRPEEYKNDIRATVVMTSTGLVATNMIESGEYSAIFLE